MDLTNLVLDILDAALKVYSVISRKPFVTVKVQYAPQEESITFAVANESSHDNEIRRIWFLTSFNRPIFSELVDSAMPVKMLVNDRTTFSVPIAELKTALNKGSGETITDVVVLDKNERHNLGRIEPLAQEAFAK